MPQGTITNFPNGVSSFGIPVTGAGNPGTITGSVFFVDSSNAAAKDIKGYGTDPTTPLATINFAATLCTADKGDTIYVLPGHTEAIVAASSISIGKAGTRVIGLGTGVKRPTLTYSALTTATVVVAAANVEINNLRFVCNLASVAVAIDTSGFAGTQIRNCDFLSTSTTKVFLITLLTDASVTDLIFENNECWYDSATSNQATEVVRLVGCARPVVRGNYFSGQFATAAVNSITTLSTEVQIQANRIQNTHATGVGIALFTGTTGTVSDNYGYTAQAANLNWLTNFYALASASNQNNLVARTLDAASTISDGQTGSTLYVVKTITSSAILSASALDLTLPSVGGDLYIRDVVLETDATGLAGGTAIQIKKDGGNGLLTFLQETVANLGANKTVNILNASAVKTISTLSSGQKIQIQSTVAPCTGAGTVKVTIVLERANAGASIVQS